MDKTNVTESFEIGPIRNIKRGNINILGYIYFALRIAVSLIQAKHTSMADNEKCVPQLRIAISREEPNHVSNYCKI